MPTVKELVAILEACDQEARAYALTQFTKPWEHYLLGVVGRQELEDQQYRFGPGIGHNDVFMVIGDEIRSGSPNAWSVAEYARIVATRAAKASTKREAVQARKAILEKIGQQYLHLETIEDRMRDELDFSEQSVTCIRGALEAAYRAGLAAGHATDHSSKCAAHW